MNKVKIKHDNKTYFVTPVENNPLRFNGDSSDYFMYQVQNEGEKIVGCIILHGLEQLVLLLLLSFLETSLKKRLLT